MPQVLKCLTGNYDSSILKIPALKLCSVSSQGTVSEEVTWRETLSYIRFGFYQIPGSGLSHGGVFSLGGDVAPGLGGGERGMACQGGPC